MILSTLGVQAIIGFQGTPFRATPFKNGPDRLGLNLIWT